MAELSPKILRDVQLVVTLPFELLERTERLIERGYARSRDTLLATAIEHFIAQLEERIDTDAQLLAMADDQDFQTLNLQIAEEFAESDYQSLKIGDDEAR
jgi:metal-responsive CopG/Arc/MetJ family transcriptional regulator